MDLKVFDVLLAQTEFEVLISDNNSYTGVTKYSSLWVDYDEPDEKTGFGIGVWEYIKMRDSGRFAVSSVGVVDGVFTICVYSK